ncbi:MAG: hypothetical protein KF764_11315 [Labilithrix sp.]|nr:hypothetical protein [Labilithrix sp.]
MMNVTATTAAIVTVLRDVDATDPIKSVEEVAEKDSAPEPDAPEKAAKREKFKDEHRAKLLAAGCDPEKVDELVAAKQIAGSRQRITPTWATVCAIETVAFWAERSDEQIEADMCKLLRRDGGQKGPAEVYAKTIFDTVIVDETGPMVEVLHVDEAAERINEHVGRRLHSARVYVTMAINELRRRRAVDPKTAKYLKVTPPAVVAEANGEEVDHG